MRALQLWDLLVVGVLGFCWFSDFVFKVGSCFLWVSKHRGTDSFLKVLMIRVQGFLVQGSGCSCGSLISRLTVPVVGATL